MNVKLYLSFLIVAGQQSLMIEQQMQLDGAFGAPVLRPIEDAGAEFDQGGIQAQQFVLETESVRSGDFAAAVGIPGDERPSN